MVAGLKLLVLISKKLTFKLCAYIFEYWLVCHLLHPPHIHSRDEWHQAFLFSTTVLFQRVVVSATRRWNRNLIHLLSNIVHKWREGYLVQTWAQKITTDVLTECSSHHQGVMTTGAFSWNVSKLWVLTEGETGTSGNKTKIAYWHPNSTKFNWHFTGNSPQVCAR